MVTGQAHVCTELLLWHDVGIIWADYPLTNLAYTRFFHTGGTTSPAKVIDGEESRAYDCLRSVS